MRFLKAPEITTMFLAFLYVLAVLLKGTQVFFLTEIIRITVLLLSFVLPSIVLIKFTEHRFQLDNILITLLILLLLVDPAAPILLLIALGALTAFFKVFVRVQGHPIFNPAAISLAVVHLFGLATTWWGVSFSPRFTQLGISSAMFFTLPLGLYIIWKYKKVPTLVASVTSLLVANFLIFGVLPLRLLLEGTFAFFLLIMATEPKTTPVIDKQEWVYGLILGASVPLWLYFKLPLTYILNLLILNVLFSLFKLVQLKLRTAKAIQE